MKWDSEVLPSLSRTHLESGQRFPSEAPARGALDAPHHCTAEAACPALADTAPPSICLGSMAILFVMTCRSWR
jgi:hypothetical protein